MDNLKDLQNTLFDMLLDIDKFCSDNEIEYFIAYGTAIGALRHKDFIPWDDDVDISMTEENYQKFLSLFKNTEKYTLQKEGVDSPIPFSKVRLNNTTFIENISYRKKWKKMHQGVYIDILCLDKVPDNQQQRKKQFIFSLILKLQALFLRGTQKWTLLQKIGIYGSVLLLPFNKKMKKYCKSFNNMNFHKYTDCILNRQIDFDESTLFPVKRVDFHGKMLPVPNDCDKYLRQIYGDYMILPSEEQRQARIHAKLFLLNEDYKKYI